MKLIVLAAGIGKRMHPLGVATPKCLLPLPDGTTLLNRLVQSTWSVPAVEEILLVAGYKVEQVEDAVSRMPATVRLRVLTNPFYARAGPLVSLWLAQPWVQDADFMVCNGDTYYTSSALTLLANQGPGIALGVDTISSPRHSDAVTVIAESGGFLRQVGKRLPSQDVLGVSTGLVAVHGRDAQLAFSTALNRLVRSREGLLRRTIWHTILNRLAEQGIATRVVAVDPSDWYEIDTPEDIYRIGTKPQFSGP